MVDAHLPKLAGTEIRSDDASLSSVLPTPSSAHELSSPWVPGSSGVDHDGPAHESSNPTASFPGCAVSQPFPLPDLPQQQPPPPTPPSNLQQHQDLPSPLKEPQPDLTTLLNPAFTVDLPSALDLPSPPLAKVQHNLRLPSFDLLGIAAPHPDHISGRPPTASAWELGSGPLSKPGDPLHALSPVPYRFRTLGEVEPSAMPSPEQAKPHVEHLIPTITPPEEPGTFHWGAFVNIRTAGMGSPPTSEPGAPPLTATSNQEFASGGLSDPAPATSPGPISGAPAWLDKAENIISKSLEAPRVDITKIDCCTSGDFQRLSERCGQSPVARTALSVSRWSCLSHHHRCHPQADPQSLHCLDQRLPCCARTVQPRRLAHFTSNHARSRCGGRGVLYK